MGIPKNKISIKQTNVIIVKLCMLTVDFFLSIPFLIDRMQSVFYKRIFASCGKNVTLRPISSDLKGIQNFYIGNNVSIPKGSVLYSTEAKLIIKDNVIFGPRPTIITGDHRYDVVGVPIVNVHEKTSENDKDVIIEEDVWTGANVIILKGVTVGRGSVVAAGAVVTRSCPPYSIIGGVPAKIIGYRFTIDQIIQHESIAYPPSERYSCDDLVKGRL